ncbi:MAG: short-chain fatty acyl-CoA regulator family protein [Pseudomonadota bacterium]
MSDSLTGSRIRERRTMMGLRQAALARSVGISASYLNLIEHNRRRIGGKLLLGIAAELGVEPSALTEGAEAALIAALREAGSEAGLASAELDRAEEFAGRFPGWAEVLMGGHRRTRSLERTVEALSDRLAHDPALAASLHEVLSTAAAIRSTAAILAEDESLAPEWQARFHGNLDQDSRRLSDSAKALVQFLDTDEGSGAAASPQEELDDFLEARGFAFPELEAGDADVPALIEDAPQLGTHAARHMARGVLGALAADAAALPLDALRAAEAQLGRDPVALAAHLGVGVARVLRRLAALHHQEAGLVVCDRSGALLFRKSLDGFALPRFGAACPLWPVFEALSRPGQVLRAQLMQSGQSDKSYLSFAVAEPTGVGDYNAAPMLQATMLIFAAPEAGAPSAPSTEVGATCRTCAAQACTARREPSILAEGL